MKGKANKLNSDCSSSLSQASSPETKRYQHQYTCTRTHTRSASLISYRIDPLILDWYNWSLLDVWEQPNVPHPVSLNYEFPLSAYLANSCIPIGCVCSRFHRRYREGLLEVDRETCDCCTWGHPGWAFECRRFHAVQLPVLLIPRRDLCYSSNKQNPWEIGYHRRDLYNRWRCNFVSEWRRPLHLCPKNWHSAWQRQLMERNVDKGGHE